MSNFYIRAALECIGVVTLVFMGLFITLLPIVTTAKVDEKLIEYEEVYNDLDERIRSYYNENEELWGRITRCEEKNSNFEIKNQSY